MKQDIDPCRGAYAFYYYPIKSGARNRLKKIDNSFFDDLHVSCRLKTGNDIAFLVDDELGEVPADIAAFGILVHLLDCQRKAHCRNALAEAFKGLFIL